MTDRQTTSKSSSSSSFNTLTAATMYKPVFDFVKTEEYKNAKVFLANANVLYLHGLSGGGKTEIAKQLGVDSGEYFLVKCASKESIKNDLIEICNKKGLDVKDFDKGDPLEKFMDLIEPPNTSVPGTAGPPPFCNLLILDDAEDMKLVGAIRQRQRVTKIIVTRQEEPFSPASESMNPIPANELKINGFTLKEAEEYLDVPKSRLDEILNAITCLPVALSAFKGALLSNQLLEKDDFIDRYIADSDKKEKDVALRCIMECLKRALADNPFYEQFVKHLSMFSRNDITADILVSLAEELDQAKGFDDANDFVNCFIKRGLCSRRQSDTGVIFITIHNLVKRAMERSVSSEETPEIIRVSMQAFSRIMPLDGRNHQYAILPKMLEHGLCLHKKLKGLYPRSITRLSQLLHGQLMTSIGYCMMSHGHDVTEVMNSLEEGLKILLKLYLNGNSSVKEVNVDEIFEKNPGSMLKSADEMYGRYIGTLQLLHRLTPRDFEVLFHPEQHKKFHAKLKEGHLKRSALDELSQKNLLLSLDELEKVYPLELLAYHLHMLSRAYDKASTNLNGRLKNKAEDIARKADNIYERIEREYRVTLLGKYVNKRHLLGLPQDDHEALSSQWKRLGEATGKAFECGMVRTKDMADDDYHKLLCLEGQLDVCGKRASIPHSRGDALRESRTLIEEIKRLCEGHKKKHMTLSKAYQKISKFYVSCEQHHDAISYAIRSMMEYREDCLENQKKKSPQSHPELDDDKRKKFDGLYDQLDLAYKRNQQRAEPYRAAGVTLEYLRSLHRCWQSRVTSRQDGGDLTYSVISDLLQELESTAVQPEAERE